MTSFFRSRSNKINVQTSRHFRIRTITEQDAKGWVEMTNRSIKHFPGSTVDEPKTQAQIQLILAQVVTTNSPDILWLVAETIDGPTDGKVDGDMTLDAPAPVLSHRLLGGVIMASLRSSQGVVRSCMARTGTIKFSMLREATLISTTDRQRVQKALIQETLRRCRLQKSSIRTLTHELLFRDDEPRLQEEAYFLQEEGFCVAGRYEEVAEKNGKLFDQMLLQVKV